MVEGVQAICRLTRMGQASGKVPLQVFDRSGGASNISWNEYQDLDPPICAELVLRARQTNAAPPTPTQPSYYGGPPSTSFNSMPQPQYGLPPTPQQPPPTMPPASATGPPNLQNIITQLDPSGLQKLLATMNQQQSPQTPQMTPQHQQSPPSNINPDLMKMLGGLQSQQQPTPAHQQSYGHPPQPQQQPQQPAQQNQYAHLLSMLGSAQGATPQPNTIGQSKPGQPDVQDLMAQLTKYKR